MPWIYHTRTNVMFNIDPNHLRGVDNFNAPWLSIDADKNTVTVPVNYTWDGCTPKLFSVLGLFWIGTPDGITLPDGYRITGKASLLHDALYQYLGQHGMTRKQCDRAFADQLRRDKFKVWWLYYFSVRLMGGAAHWLSSFTRK